MFNNIHSVFNGLGSTDINCNDKTITQVPLFLRNVELLGHSPIRNQINYSAQYIGRHD
jgi:hypothetical protein